MKQTIYICILALYGFMTGITAYAQKTDIPGVGKDIGKIDDLAPGKTIRPTENWTDEMYRQWENTIKKVSEENVKPDPHPVIKTPDFSKMTDEQITAWENSVINILYPPMDICTYNKSTGKIETLPVSKQQIKETDTELRYGYANDYVPISVPIDKNKIVGEIPISSSVMPNGALTYQVPLDIYPGINGFQPQLSLNYNSLGGNGLVGVGWNIGGLSSITRTVKNQYYNSKSEGVLMNKTDPFLLDGLRLIKISENTSEIKYETERGQIKATAYLSGNLVRYFKVWYPNGNTGIYGYSSNTVTDYLSYPLMQLTDRFNNTITFSYIYTSSTNCFTLTKVSYGNASVEFSYHESRTDKPFYYQGGRRVEESKLLASMTCKYGASVLRKYSMSYISQKDLSHLSQIDMQSGGSNVNPLKFYYGKNNNASGFSISQSNLLEWYNFTNPDQLRTSRGKFEYGTDNDGVIISPNKNPYFNVRRNANTFQHSRNRYENYYDGTEKIFLYTGLANDGYTDAMPNLLTEEGFIDIFCANIDGKYEDEVIKINNTRIDNTNEKVTFKVYSGNWVNGLHLSSTRTFNFPTVVKDNDDGRSIHPKFYFTGDFNGDGKMEVLAVSSDKPAGISDISSKCYLFDLQSGSKLYESPCFPYVVDFIGTFQTNLVAATENTDHLIIMDYDGDGKSDICHVNSSGTHIYTFDVSGSSYSMRKVTTYTEITKSSLQNRQLLAGEFNGDGLMDLLVSPAVSGGYNWDFHYSTGNGQFSKTTVSGTYFSRSEPIYLQDVNGDGITDILKKLGSGFFTYLVKPNKTIQVENYHSFTANSAIIPVDINSSNYFNRIVTIKSNIASKHAFPRNDFHEKLLTGVVNSFGVIERNHYRKLDESNIHVKGSGAAYPYINFQGPMYVPVNREQYYNSQRYYDISLSYENAVIHKQGLGFCGFQKIKNYDNIRYREIAQTYDPLRLGVMTGEESPAAKVTNTYSVSVQTNRITKINLTNRTVQDKLKGVTQTASYGYDTYGNPTNETINFGDNIIQTTTNIYHNQTESPYMIGFLTDQTVTVSRSGTSNSKRMYISSHENGLPKTKIGYANGNKTSESTYSYYPNGILKEESAKPYSSTNTLTSKYEYDSYGRITKLTDPLGFNTTYVYNTSTGVLASMKNHKSHITSFGYDAMWRRSSASYPDGVNETTNYTWSSGAGSYSVSSSVTGKPNSTVYYDVFGREVRASVTRFNGVTGHTDKVYDSYGRLQKESLPFTGTNASYWNSYSYDSYDRLSTITYASGKRTTYSYSGKNVTTVDNGISSTQKYDAQGNLIAVTDPAGTITYNLRPDGQPSNIIAPGNITTSFGYDGYGRQTSISDPSAGNRTFAYDAAGNLQRETDANNRSKTMGYDVYGRITSKVLPEFTTSYGYDRDGLLASETSNNSTSHTYEYDSYGRLYKERDNGPDSKWIEKVYSYSAGNLASVQFTSQSGAIGTESYVYANGHLSEIKLGSTSIWKLNAENVLGMPTSVITGTVTRTYGYNAYGIPTARSSYSSAGGTFQNATYSFDATKGNLIYRKDNNRNRQENFEYDNLNRLKTYAGITVGYDIKGNITSKADVGSTFYYNMANKPYAISGVDAGTSGAIPPRNQSITYTSFERPGSLSENGYVATFTYDGSGSRKKMQISKNGSSQLSRYYLGGRYELDQEAASSTKQKLYVGGDAYSAPAVYVNLGSGWVLYYICRDYLGSITHLVNSNGTVAQETSYDAWGRLRNPADQVVYSPDNEPTLFLGRGYTGHEHLTMFGLINMNARLYDPAIGRFLSPDPYVQAPYFSQNFNRYSYAMNNPLVYVDEDGEWIQYVIGAVVGGVINVAVNWKNIDNFGQGLSYFGVGAVSGALAATGNTFAIAGAGALMAGGNSWLTQGYQNGFDNVNWNQVGKSALVGGIASVVTFGVTNLVQAPISSAFSSISSPVLREGLTYGTTGAVTGFSVGTGMSLASGESLGDALAMGGKTAALGFGFGFAGGAYSGFKYAKANDLDPWTGQFKFTDSNNIKIGYNFTPDPYGDNVTLYRGTTGTEKSNIPLFMTDDPAYAATYVKSGGQMIEVTIPRSTLSQMRMDGILTNRTGLHTIGRMTTPNIEYKFNDYTVKQQILNQSRPYKP